MRFKITLKILIGTIGWLLLFSNILNGQIYSFMNYGAERNIPNGFVYTINQSNDGFLWVGTGNGLSRFDGFSFFNVPYPDSIIGRYPTVSLKDKNGILWFGCSDGSVFYTRDNKLISVPFPSTKSISDLLEGPNGLIYILPQGKAVFSINPVKPEEIHKYSFSSDPIVFSASFTNSGSLLIGTQENILVCKLNKDSVSVTDIIGGFDYSSVTSIYHTDKGSRYVVGTDGNGLFQLQISGKGAVLTRFRNHPEWGISKHSVYLRRFRSLSLGFYFRIRSDPISTFR